MRRLTRRLLPASQIMNVEFYAADPRERSRPRLDEILRQGVDQLAIACAFCTAAGVEILMRHVSRLSKPDSFLVVAVAPPTDYAALNNLHQAIPGNLFIHWGMYSPIEVKNGAALMHSKVFYARAGNNCWLWTGSHNLTGNATQGGNCEAAVLLTGSAEEQPFIDAMKHLQACKSEATPYDPDATPPGGGEPADILVIHAETDVVLSDPFPWHIHLCLDSANFDDLMKTGQEVRLFLYSPGALLSGWQSATPLATYSGSLTGINLTEINPRARNTGVPAEWRAANFSITEDRGVLVLGPDRPPDARVMTQAVISIDRSSDFSESLLSEAPKVEPRLISGKISLSSLDSDMRQFFRKGSVDGANLIRRPYTGRRHVISMAADAARESDIDKIKRELAPDRNLTIELEEPTDAKLAKQHPFIIRARYRMHLNS